MSDEVFKIRIDDSELESALKAFKELEKIGRKFNAAKGKEKQGDEKGAKEGVKAEKERLSIIQKIAKLKDKERKEEKKHNDTEEKRQKRMAKNIQSMARLSKFSAVAGFLEKFTGMANDIRAGRFAAGGLGMDWETLKKAQKASKQLFGDEGTLTGVMQSVQAAAVSPDAQGALATLGVNTADFDKLSSIDKMAAVFDAASKLDFSGIGGEYLRDAFSQVTGLDALQFAGNEELFSEIKAFIKKQEVGDTDDIILTIAQKVESIENTLLGVANGILDKVLPKAVDFFTKAGEIFGKVQDFFTKLFGGIRDFFAQVKAFFENTIGKLIETINKTADFFKNPFEGAGNAVKDWWEGRKEKKEEKRRANDAAGGIPVEAADTRANDAAGGIPVEAADTRANDAAIFKDGKIVKLSNNDNIFATKADAPGMSGRNSPGWNGAPIKLDITIRDTVGAKIANSIVSLPYGVV